jgi:hypothetical protein
MGRRSLRRANKFTMSTKHVQVHLTPIFGPYGGIVGYNGFVPTDALTLKGGDSTVRPPTDNKPGSSDSPVIPSEPASRAIPAASPWVALSEREPTNIEKRDGIWTWDGEYICFGRYASHCPIGARVRFWKSALQDVPAPPQPEACQMSQEERDYEAYLPLWNKFGESPKVHSWPIVKRMLEHERRYLGCPAEQFKGELLAIEKDFSKLNGDHEHYLIYRRIGDLLAKAPMKP